TTSANGLSTTRRWDATGSGTFNLTETDLITLSPNGGRSETVAYSGARSDVTTTITSADLNTVTLQVDLNGDGVVEQSSVTTKNADGSHTITLSDFANGSLKDQSVTIVSANGLSTTIERDPTGSGTFSQERTDVTVLNPDGSRTETVRDFNPANPSVSTDQMIVTTSANGLSTTTQWDLTGSGTFTSRTDVTTLN